LLLYRNNTTKPRFSIMSSLKRNEGYPKIILFGDSLTQYSFDTANRGFGAALQNYYARRADVVNRGYSGFNTTWLLPHFKNVIRLLQAADSEPPLLFTILLGTNDSVHPNYPQHVPLDEYEKNLRYYVDTLLSHPMTKGTKIVLITPPPMDIPPPAMDEVEIPVVTESSKQGACGGGITQLYMNKKKYAEKVMEIARSYEGANNSMVAGLDFWTAMINFGRAKEKEKGDVEVNQENLPGSGLPGAWHFGKQVFTDGLHLGPLGYEVLTNELLAIITNKWPELRKEAVKLQAPWWGDLPEARDSDDVEARRKANKDIVEDGVVKSKWLL